MNDDPVRLTSPLFFRVGFIRDAKRAVGCARRHRGWPGDVLSVGIPIGMFHEGCFTSAVCSFEGGRSFLAVGGCVELVCPRGVFVGSYVEIERTRSN